MKSALGVLLVWGGCGLVGLHACAALRRRVRFLEEMALALTVMERELLLNRRPLPELLEQMSQTTERNVGMLFARCRSKLEQGNSFTDVWRETLENSGLKEGDKALLGTLSVWLGRYEAKGQAEALARLRTDWDEHIRLTRRQAMGQGRIYGVLGLTAGGFLSLLLL